VPPRFQQTARGVRILKSTRAMRHDTLLCRSIKTKRFQRKPPFQIRSPIVESRHKMVLKAAHLVRLPLRMRTHSSAPKIISRVVLQRNRPTCMDISIDWLSIKMYIMIDRLTSPCAQVWHNHRDAVSHFPLLGSYLWSHHPLYVVYKLRYLGNHAFQGCFL
jgi:hypothetical protein